MNSSHVSNTFKISSEKVILEKLLPEKVSFLNFVQSHGHLISSKNISLLEIYFDLEKNQILIENQGSSFISKVYSI